MTNHIEETPAGVIDWKMEVERLNRLLAAAEVRSTDPAYVRLAKRITDAILEQCEVRLRANTRHLPAGSGQMSDLVKRLNVYGTGSPDSLLLMREAADEIEALRQRFDEAVANAAKWEQRFNDVQTRSRDPQ